MGEVIWFGPNAVASDEERVRALAAETDFRVIQGMDTVWPAANAGKYAMAVVAGMMAYSFLVAAFMDGMLTPEFPTVTAQLEGLVWAGRAVASLRPMLETDPEQVAELADRLSPRARFLYEQVSTYPWESLIAA